MDHVFSIGDKVIYKKPLKSPVQDVHSEQHIPCTITAVYGNGTVTVQPIDSKVSKKVVKTKHLALIS